MSLLAFAKNFVGASGQQAARSLTEAVVSLAPDLATAAELATMEEQLDAIGVEVTKTQRDLARERQEYDQINARYSQMIGAAENLQGQIDTEQDAGRKTSVEASLVKLLDQIEPLRHELDQEKSDVDETQALLTELETAYQQKARELTEAKNNLTRARQDMKRAEMQEERAADRAETARRAAGLVSGRNNVNVALDAMRRTADASRQRAATHTLKTTALNGIKSTDSSEDPNIKAAMAAAAGKTSSVSAKDRLAALKR
jgi:chromosome segregation ATPase